jgi:hypothetical protein
MELRADAFFIHRNGHHKNSNPIPTWNPRRDPSLLLATSGRPKLTSIRTGSKLYIRPIPADTDGFESEAATLSLSEWAVPNVDK